MNSKLTNFLQTACHAAGIEAAAYAGDGALLYRTGDFDCGDLIFAHGSREITQPEGSDATIVPLRNGVTVILRGTGESYLRYAALIRAAADMKEESVSELSPTEKFRRYFVGELDERQEESLAAQYAGAFDAYVLTLIAESSAKCKELCGFLETMRERGDFVIPFDDTKVAFIKHCGEEDEYHSAADFAFTLYDNICEELRIKFVINVGGTVHEFRQLRDVFHRCGLAYSFGKMMRPNGTIYSYKEYMLIKMLSDIPDETLEGYYHTLLEREDASVLDDAELTSTAEEFLKNSLNISETSRSMYMHRNTLLYRLDKIEQATGLNLRHFNDAMAFRILTILDKLVKNKKNRDTRGKKPRA